MSLITTAPWLWARDQMNSARFKDRGKPLCLNTRIVVSRMSPTDVWNADDTVYACLYHGTEVVQYHPGNRVAVSFQGWPTITTKVRIRRFSPMTLSTEKGQIFACVGSGPHQQSWPGGAYTWFWWQEGRMVFRDGGPMPDLKTVRIKLNVPKRRDTLTRTLEGDAFREGIRSWVAAKRRQFYGDSMMMLYPYYGDHPDDRSLFITDNNESPRDLLSSLELLAGSHGPALKPIDRFLWKKPAEQA
jgi:hypothetical protein